MPRNTKRKNGFESFDKVRRLFYCSWADKTCPFLTSLFDSKQLVLPLNLALEGLLPPSDGGFPVAISKTRLLDAEKLDRLIAELDNTDKSKAPGLKSVAGYQFIDASGIKNVLDNNFCVLDVVVTPPRQNVLYLCKLPEFWKLDLPSDDMHIGGTPKRMDFQEIVLRCSGPSLAKTYLSTFFQCNERPILITDVGSLDGATIKGLARIPWTLVVDFDFGSSNTLRDLAQEAPYVYKVFDLPLYKGFTVNSEDMSDVSFVYWLKALGPSSDQTTDMNSWRLHFQPQVSKYVTRACSLITTNVKILVVWSTQQASTTFGQAIADLCLTAEQAQPLHMTEIAMISSAVVSPFLTKFKSCELPRPPKVMSMNLASLSDFISQDAAIGGISSRWRSVPHKEFQLPVETVRSMQANEVDYLYPDFENDLDMTNYDDGLKFFDGRAKFVRWEDFKAKNVVDRPETQNLYKIVKSCLKNRCDTKIIHFPHNPGTGGSTVARHVMWRLRKTFCCVVPSQIYSNLRRDVKQLIDTSEGRAVLVLWDSNVGIDCDALISVLNGLKVVILCVDRSFEKRANATQIGLLEESLSLNTLEQFVILLRQNTHLSNSREALDLLMVSAQRMNEKVPLFLVMVTALERRFLRLRDYVKERLIGITEEQKILLSRIAFARFYTGQALQVRAVSTHNTRWEDSLPTPVLGLITFGWQQSRRVRTRHHCIDELVLSEISGIENTSADWGLWLANFVVSFIELFRTMYPDIPEWDSSGSNEFERNLRRLFHERSDHSQLPYFLSLIGSLAGKDCVTKCMGEVIEKLPRITRIRAHFLGDLARVHLHMDGMNLQAALQVMKDAHALFPLNRTLYHQEGQLYFDAMKLTPTNFLIPKEPAELAKDVIILAKQASDCFAISRDCKMQGRTSELYPWTTDVKCHIECLTDICSLMRCSFHTLPQPLANHEYILNARQNIMFLLETLSTEDPNYYRDSRIQILNLLGNKQDLEDEITTLFKEIDGCSCLEEEPGDVSTKNLKQLATSLQQTSYLLRLKYSCARMVPKHLSNRLTLAIIRLIDQPRVINSVFAHKGHPSRHFELELLWDWSRYSKQPINPTGMLSIIEKYLEKLITPSLLRAKCLLFKGVTLLLQLLCEHNPNVNPADVTRPIAECKTILESVLHTENRNWRYREFLTEGYGNGLLSSKDWFRNGSFHRDVNESIPTINSGYEKSQHTNLREFSGYVISRDDHHGTVFCEGLQLFFVPNNAPSSWRVNSGEVKFYISVSSQKGLRAYPVSPPEVHENPTRIHHWVRNQLQMGRIHKIDQCKGLVYFTPPDPTQPYGAKAYCRIEDIPITPVIGDLYEFYVHKIKGPPASFEAYDLRFIKAK